jgi:hypothetical protein
VRSIVGRAKINEKLVQSDLQHPNNPVIVAAGTNDFPGLDLFQSHITRRSGDNLECYSAARFTAKMLIRFIGWTRQTTLRQHDSIAPTIRTHSRLAVAHLPTLSLPAICAQSPDRQCRNSTQSRIDLISNVVGSVIA